MTPEQARDRLRSLGLCGEILGPPDDPHACILEKDHAGDHGTNDKAPPLVVGQGGATLVDATQCQEEIIQMITAWADRGLSPAESAELIAGTSHAMLAHLGYELEEVVDKIRRSWTGRRNDT